MFKVIKSNNEIAITLPQIARLRANLVVFHHVTDDTLQMFKVKGQGHSVFSLAAKRYNTAMDRFSDLTSNLAWRRN